MSRFPDHPGTITRVDLFDKSSREVPASEVPEVRRFVYFENGAAAMNPASATERVPIVLVETMPTDGAGTLVPKDMATIIRVNEYGPGRRPLRSIIQYPEKE